MEDYEEYHYDDDGDDEENNHRPEPLIRGDICPWKELVTMRDNGIKGHFDLEQSWRRSSSACWPGPV